MSKTGTDSGSEQLPVTFGYDFDIAVNDLYRGLIVNGIRRTGNSSGPLF